jgi:regulator of RNase E activity RraA
MGAQLTRFAYENGWAGVVINGCIRDSEETTKLPSG